VCYQILGPYPCERSFFENCKKQTANSNPDSTLYVGAPTGTPRLLAILLTGMNPQVNECQPPGDETTRWGRCTTISRPRD
jgi:hypothetical protein